MHRKFVALYLALATLLAFPSTATGHGGGTHGVYPWEPPGSGGEHTLGVCLDSSMYGGGSWNLGDPAHARLWEAMYSWHSVYGSQALVRRGPGSGYACPSQSVRLIVYVVPGNGFPFYGSGDKMQAQHSHLTCTGHWPSSSSCNQNSSIYINDDYLWYVGTGTPTAGSYDFESGLLHELGHSLGLSDITGCYTPYVMCGTLNVQQIRRTLDPHDVENLQYLYVHFH
ncbi:MAG TPA: matrixin family metalloprotease [Thermoleophilaceae bacterium]|nr:matrixin family metalloprotease [Thermoleophilaceae bacterium]